MLKGWLESMLYVPPSGWRNQSFSNKAVTQKKIFRIDKRPTLVFFFSVMTPTVPQKLGWLYP